MIGYLSAQAAAEPSLELVQPVAVAAGGQVPFWCGVLVPGSTRIAADYALLGKASASQVFPVRYRSHVPLVGGPIEGEIRGFVVVEDFRTLRTRCVT